MSPGRRFVLPIDPWPRANLGERLAVATVLALLLLLPFCAMGAALLALALLTVHVYRSYGLGAALRGLVERRRAPEPAGPPLHRTAPRLPAGGRR